MSLETWKKEFYPKAPSARMTKRQAIEHSILKWTGLLPKNLKKHGVVADTEYEHRIQDTDPNNDDILLITSVSRALCKKYEDDYLQCHKCPLFKHLGNKRCDSFGRTPYRIWMNTKNPRPMIKALKALLEE